MQYRVTYVSHGHTLVSETRKQFPAARRALEAATYTMLEGHGLLDRPIAHRHMRTASKVTRDVHSATIALDDRCSVTLETIGAAPRVQHWTGKL